MEFGNQKTTPFLTFSGQAEEAMSCYTSLFEQSRIDHLVRHADGKVLHAKFTIKGQTYMCIDSAVKHEWGFTPAISLFVACDTVDEIDRLYAELSRDGQVLMPLGDSPFSEKFAWVNDRFGVSWQLNLAKPQPSSV
ncbi:VOC family protein [Cohnella nanjingensis]|uniref:VOC family protein n=1 Tax=Cohnella nanjingensis TaxID=1387779 RepID=A0A7X0VII2_9BACL|nr:VOC family protein [Cohnella nanjingensis]MBB6675217.1 VOC family protein [Cohnella nanjingensis]